MDGLIISAIFISAFIIYSFKSGIYSDEKLKKDTEYEGENIV